VIAADCGRGSDRRGLFQKRAAREVILHRDLVIHGQRSLVLTYLWRRNHFFHPSGPRPRPLGKEDSLSLNHRKGGIAEIDVGLGGEGRGNHQVLVWLVRTAD